MLKIYYQEVIIIIIVHYYGYVPTFSLLSIHTGVLFCEILVSKMGRPGYNHCSRLYTQCYGYFVQPLYHIHDYFGLN